MVFSLRPNSHKWIGSRTNVLFPSEPTKSNITNCFLTHCNIRYGFSLIFFLELVVFILYNINCTKASSNISSFFDINAFYREYVTKNIAHLTIRYIWSEWLQSASMFDFYCYGKTVSSSHSFSDTPKPLSALKFRSVYSLNCWVHFEVGLWVYFLLLIRRHYSLKRLTFSLHRSAQLV